nr:hypothetical protein RAR13_11675 [Aminobacter aminovorans]
MIDPWEAIQNDPELSNARRKLSIHEFRLIIKHATTGTVPLAAYEAAVKGRQEFRDAYRAAHSKAKEAQS